jgi:hypothetical protein
MFILNKKCFACKSPFRVGATRHVTWLLILEIKIPKPFSVEYSYREKIESDFFE